MKSNIWIQKRQAATGSADMVATERSLKRIPTFMKLDLSVVDPQEPGLEFSGSSTVRNVTSGSPWQHGACRDGTSNPNRSAGQSAIDVQSCHQGHTLPIVVWSPSFFIPFPNGQSRNVRLEI